MTLDPVLQMTLRSALALLLLSVAVHKLRDPRAFHLVLAAYRIFPEAALSMFVTLVICAELGIGLALLWPATGSLAPFGAAALLALYAGAIALNLLRGRRAIDCGCGGPAGAQPLSPALVVRNVVLVGSALVAALPAAPRVWLWVDAVTLVGGVLALALVYVALDVTLANAARQRTLGLHA